MSDRTLIDVAAPAADSPAAHDRPALPPVPRRRMISWLSAGGLVLVGGLANLLGTAQPARADCQGSPCCHLASCRVCSWSTSRCRYTCPGGYYKRYWYCAAGARFIGCGECTTSSSSCWSGSFYCSIWWDDAYCY